MYTLVASVHNPPGGTSLLWLFSPVPITGLWRWWVKEVKARCRQWLLEALAKGDNGAWRAGTNNHWICSNVRLLLRQLIRQKKMIRKKKVLLFFIFIGSWTQLSILPDLKKVTAFGKKKTPFDFHLLISRKFNLHFKHLNIITSLSHMMAHNLLSFQF